MSEIERFNFLVNRDSLEAAVDWEMEAAELYELAANNAMNPDIRGPKGSYWESIYRLAAEDCLNAATEGVCNG